MTGVDASSFAKKVDLASLKTNVDKLDTDEFRNVPTNWSNLKSKVDKLDFSKLASVSVDLSKLNDTVQMMLMLKRMRLRVKHLLLLIAIITNCYYYNCCSDYCSK